jgi:endonuclease YncB( thermonuclease family)
MAMTRIRQKDNRFDVFKYLIIPVFIVFGTLGTSGANGKSYGSVKVDEVTSIYDGDTFRVNINSWPAIVGNRIPVRVNGVDTPELRGKCQKEKELARKAKQFTVSMLRSTRKIELRNIKRGKYFRIVADVLVNGKSLGKNLINNGLAVQYDGGAKIDWCN